MAKRRNKPGSLNEIYIREYSTLECDHLITNELESPNRDIVVDTNWSILKTNNVFLENLDGIEFDTQLKAETMHIMIEVEKILQIKKNKNELYKKILPFLYYIYEIIHSEYGYNYQILSEDWWEDEESNVLIQEMYGKDSIYHKFLKEIDKPVVFKNLKDCFEKNKTADDPLLTACMYHLFESFGMQRLEDYYVPEESIPLPDLVHFVYNEGDPLSEYSDNFLNSGYGFAVWMLYPECEGDFSIEIIMEEERRVNNFNSGLILFTNLLTRETS